MILSVCFPALKHIIDDTVDSLLKHHRIATPEQSITNSTFVSMLEGFAWRLISSACSVHPWKLTTRWNVDSAFSQFRKPNIAHILAIKMHTANQVNSGISLGAHQAGPRTHALHGQASVDSNGSAKICCDLSISSLECGMLNCRSRSRRYF